MVYLPQSGATTVSIAILEKWNLDLGGAKGWKLAPIDQKTFQRWAAHKNDPRGSTLESVISNVWQKCASDPDLKARVFASVNAFQADAPRDWETKEELLTFIAKNWTVELKPVEMEADNSTVLPYNPRRCVVEMYPTRVGDTLKDIKDRITNKLPLSFTSFYIDSTGAIRWFALCADHSNDVFRISADAILNNAKEIIGSCGTEFIWSCPMVVSLGPGDGQKDRSLVHQLVSDAEAMQGNLPLTYHPYDINALMLERAYQTADLDEPKLMKTVGILADFSILPQVISDRPEPERPILFLFLGNTLGNMEHEEQFLDRLHSVMKDSDRAIIEVRLAEQKVSRGADDRKRNEFNFTPLEMVGVAFDKSKFSWKNEKISSIDGTITVVGRYENFVLPWIEDKVTTTTATLAYIHHYSRDGITKTLEKKFEILLALPNPRTILFVVKKKGAS